MSFRVFGLGLGLAALISISVPALADAQALRVMSLDQCADQYVLALRPDAEIRLSSRADDADSYMRNQAKGLPTIRPTLESAIAFRPDVVVRYWGGDARLMSRLQADGVTIAHIQDVQDFAGIRVNIESVAKALGVPQRGLELISSMDAKLALAHGKGRNRPATYITASGFTAGPKTLLDSVIRAAGFRNGTLTSGYQPLGLERTVLSPPVLFIRGFFELMLADWRGVGRHPVLQPLMKTRAIADLPASTLTCPAWFAADAAVDLAEGRS